MKLAKFYEPRTKPFAHQITGLDQGWERPEFAYFCEMGTGKTKIAIDNAAMLYEKGLIDAILIFAPKGVYRNWIAELEVHLPERFTSRVAHWSPNPRKDELEDMKYVFMLHDDLSVFVMNIESLSTNKGQKVAEHFTISHKTLIIIDESTSIKSTTAQRTKAAIRLGKFAKYRRILTGSPITNSPLDLYSQAAFLDWHLLGFSSFYTFRNRYAVLQNQFFGGRKVSVVVGYQRTEELADQIKQWSYRVLKKDCLDLPDKIYMKREVELSDDQKRLYEEMRDTAIATLQDDRQSTVTIVLTQLMRLQQIVCGYLRLDDDSLEPIANNRLAALMEALEEVEGKVIIWSTFRANVADIASALRKEYGNDSTVEYHGGIPPDERKKSVELFQDEKSPTRFFLDTQQSGGYGITLTQAGTVIYFSNSYDLEKRMQSEDRAHRIGQKKAVTYLDFVSPNTVDEKILKALRSKVNIADKVMGESWREWL